MAAKKLVADDPNARVVCGDGFPHDTCILSPDHAGPHDRLPVTTTGERVAYGINKVTYGDVVAGKTRYVTPEEMGEQP